MTTSCTVLASFSLWECRAPKNDRTSVRIPRYLRYITQPALGTTSSMAVRPCSTTHAINSVPQRENLRDYYIIRLTTGLDHCCMLAALLVCHEPGTLRIISWPTCQPTCSAAFRLCSNCESVLATRIGAAGWQ